MEHFSFVLRRKTMQRVTEKTKKKIRKIRRIVAVKYDKYTPSIFREGLKVNISVMLISISFLKNILKIRFVFYTLQTIHGCGILKYSL